MKGSTRKYVDRKCQLCSTKFVLMKKCCQYIYIYICIYIYIYVYIYVLYLLYDSEGVKNPGDTICNKKKLYKLIFGKNSIKKEKTKNILTS